MTVRKMIVIAVREYESAVRTKAFLITLIAMPVMMVGSVVVQLLLKDTVDTHDKHIVVVDHSGRLYGAIADAAEKYNSDEIFADSEDGEQRQIKPRFLVEEAHDVPDDPEQADLTMSDRVRDDEETLAFIVIGADILDPKAEGDPGAVRYHSNSPTYFDFIKWVSPQINRHIRKLRCEEAGLDPAVVKAVTSPVRLQNLGLVSLDESGQIKQAEETNRAANFLVPMGMMMLMFMVVLVSASPLMTIVMEEKMLRIAEVLLASVSPFQLMMGKLLGIVGVSLTLATIYLVGGFLAAWYGDYLEFFPRDVVWWFVIYLALAVLMFGSMCIAIGAAVTDTKEAQSMMMPVTVLAIVPMFFWMNVVKEPTSTFATVTSLIPPFTPMLMILRQSVPPGVPTWQPVLGIVLVLLTTTACVYVASRIFRVGILIQGKGASFAEMIRWALRG